jgi:hypothetical protein
MALVTDSIMEGETQPRDFAMRIGHHHHAQPVTPATADAAATSTPRSASSDTAPAAGNGYTPSAQLLDLTTRAQQDPEIRADRIRDVGERLRQGFYALPASAAATADALLGAAD